MTVIDWLLDSDPAIRWQVMRDLTDEPADVVAAERARVATEGWGARLLALQATGRPVGRPAVHAGLDRHVPPWSSCGASASTPRASRRGGRSACVREHVTWGDGAWSRPAVGRQRAFFEGEVEPCINGNVVAIGAYFGEDWRRSSTGCSASSSRRRLELRGGERRDGVVVRHHDQRRSRACSSTSERSAARPR